MASPRGEAAVAREELIKQKKNEKKSQTMLAVKLNIVPEATESPLTRSGVTTSKLDPP